MVSISQWIHSHLPSDADLGITPKALNDTSKDLQRFSKQSGNGLASIGYKTLGAAFEFGRTIITPFEKTSRDLDRLARQSDSTVAKLGYSTVGVFFSLGIQGLPPAP